MGKGTKKCRLMNLNMSLLHNILTVSHKNVKKGYKNHKKKIKQIFGD